MNAETVHRPTADSPDEETKNVESPPLLKRRDSIQTPADLQDDPEIHATTLRMWGILALYADDEGRVMITLNQIAKRATFVSQRQALVQMQTLERLGLVDVERGMNGYRKIPNVYTLRYSRPKNVGKSVAV